MTNKVNCEAFQVRAGAGRLSAEKGLALTEFNGRLFIDPQLENNYKTSLGCAPKERLKLELSKRNPPKVESSLVKEFSIARDALINYNLVRRYRVFEKAEQAVGRYAIVGIVNHDGSQSLVQRIKNSRASTELEAYRHHYKWSSDVTMLSDPFVQLLAVPEGGSFVVPHYVGDDFNGEMVDFDFTYIPDSAEGLARRRNDIPQPPEQKDGGGTSGDREPRKPIHPHLSGNTSLS